MNITFTGVPNEDHKEITQYGVRFPLNEAVDVRDPRIIGKLQNHPHFKVESQEAQDIAYKERGKPQGDLKTMTRLQLEDVAADLGLKVDGRWSDARVMEEIDKASNSSDSTARA